MPVSSFVPGWSPRPWRVSKFADSRTDTAPRATQSSGPPGFSRDYSWIDVARRRGPGDRSSTTAAFTEVPGLSFIGLPWQHTRGSSLLGFVRHDAAWLVDRITARSPHANKQSSQKENAR